MYYPEFELLDISIPSWYIFGWLNVILAKIIFIRIGFKRGIGELNILTLALAYTLGAAIGAIFIQSIMAVLLLSAIFLFITKKLLHVTEALGDMLAINFAVAIGIGRLGCLFNGCCFGSPTSLPWGIHYPHGSLPHWFQASIEKIDASASTSIAIHPVPIYESLFLIICAISIFIIGRRFKSTRGKIFPLFLVAYFMFRVIIESIRDHTNVWWSSIQLGPFNAFQWALIFGSAITIILTYNGKRLNNLLNSIDPKIGHSNTVIAALLFSSFLVLFFNNHFYQIQLVQLYVLIPASVLLHIRDVRQSSSYKWVPAFSWGTAMVFVLIIPFIENTEINASDTIFGNQIRSKPAFNVINPRTNKLVRLGDEHLSLDKFHTMNQYLNLVENDAVAEKSYVDSLRDVWETSYTIGASVGYFQIETCGGVDPYTYGGIVANMQRTKQNGPRDYFTIGTRLSAYKLGESEDSFHLNGSSILKFDLHKAGFGIGAGAYYYEEKREVFNNDNQLYDPDFRSEFILLPAFHLRLGRMNKNLSLGFLDQELFAAEPMPYHISITLPDETGGNHRFGVTSFHVIPSLYYMPPISSGRYGLRVIFHALPPLGDSTLGLGIRLAKTF